MAVSDLTTAVIRRFPTRPGSVRERKMVRLPVEQISLSQYRHLTLGKMVPLAGLEPACLAAFDFESNASTNFATGAAKRRC